MNDVLASPSETYTHPSSRDERRRAVNGLIVAAYSGTSHEAPQGAAMRVAVSVWMAALDRAGVPSEVLIDLLGRELAERTNSFPPSVTDITRQWRVVQAERPNKTIQQEDAERMNALPQGQDGPGRRAFLALGARRGVAVVCDCGKAAQLSSDSEMWQCRALACSFSWPVANTANAPAPSQRGPIAAQVHSVASEAERAVKAVKKAAGGNHSPVLLAFAQDCDINLDACTPQQYVEFRRFAHWFRDSYPGCKITPGLLAEEYPRFQADTAPEVSYA